MGFKLVTSESIASAYLYICLFMFIFGFLLLCMGMCVCICPLFCMFAFAVLIDAYLLYIKFVYQKNVVGLEGGRD